MTTFVLPLTDGRPSDIIDFKVDLVLSPPEVNEGEIIGIDQYISTHPEIICINYNDAPTDEGRLNIYICRFKTGKFRLHIFGRIKGQEFRTEKEMTETSYNTWAVLNKKIKYVLLSSRNILRSYYLNANVKSIENLLLAFIIP